ncbi:MAG: preprotein translocase subunit SecE [Desulfobacterales bacterium]
MGRLKRKKTSYKKKKKKQSTGTGTSSQIISDAVASKTTLLTESSKDTKKMQVKPSTGLVPVAEKLKKGYLDKILQFLREVKVELKKVTWPSRKQTIGSTVVVIVLVIVVSLFLGIVDIGLSSLIRVILR